MIKTDCRARSVNKTAVTMLSWQHLTYKPLVNHLVDHVQMSSIASSIDYLMHRRNDVARRLLALRDRASASRHVVLCTADVLGQPVVSQSVHV